MLMRTEILSDISGACATFAIDEGRELEMTIASSSLLYISV